MYIASRIRSDCMHEKSINGLVAGGGSVHFCALRVEHMLADFWGSGYQYSTGVLGNESPPVVSTAPGLYQ